MDKVDEFIESLREIEDRFGKTSGMLKAIPDLPIRNSDKLIRLIFRFTFHIFLIRIQKHLVEDYYLRK
jgi:hypothetical protein